MEIIKTIMIVGNEPAIFKQVESYLHHEDVEIITAMNNREALEHLNEQNEEAFDLILINTKMPGSKKKTAFFSINPVVNKQKNNSFDNFLQIPFTKKEFLDFIKNKMK